MSSKQTSRVMVVNAKNKLQDTEQVKRLFRLYHRLAKKYSNLDVTLVLPPVAAAMMSRMKMPDNLALATYGLSAEGDIMSTGCNKVAQEMGISTVVVGHRDHVSIYKQPREQIKQQIVDAIASGMNIVVCFGEIERDTEGLYLEELREQLDYIVQPFLEKRGSLSLLSLAYEPQWLVGNEHEPLSEDEVFAVILFIRNILSSWVSEHRAKQVPFIYGGSVDAQYVRATVDAPGLSGVMVGRSGVDEVQAQEIAETLGQS